MVLVGLGILFAWRNSHRQVEAGGPGPTRLAVLPFENLGRPEDEYFADGVTDEVRGKLTALPGLEVIARTSSSQYKQTTKSPQQIGRELGVAVSSDGHRAVGEGRHRRDEPGAASVPSWSRSRRLRPSGKHPSRPRSPTCSRCRGKSPAEWPRRSA